MNLCHTCNSSEIYKTVQYKNIPVMQSIIYKTLNDAQNCRVGDINIYICKNCGSVFNKTFSPESLQYTVGYENSQDYSDTFFKHLSDIKSYIMKSTNNPKSILEIGCGKGKFLKLLANETDASCYGYDPSYLGKEEILNGRVKFIKRYFEETDVNKKHDIVIMRHVIEHINNPLVMLNMIYKAMNDDGILYIETPNLEWILKNKVIFDFTYEHCNYFTLDTIKELLAMSKLNIVDERLTFGEQYISIIVRKSDILKLNHYNEKEILKNKLLNDLYKFEDYKNKAITDINKQLMEIKKNGNCCFWGSAGKGVMCCNMFDEFCKYISCVVDINPNKQGGYIAHTGHPIIAPEQLIQFDIKSVFVTNSNYYDEIKSMVYHIQLDIEVYNLEKMLERI